MTLIKGKQIESLIADKIVENDNKQFISLKEKQDLRDVIANSNTPDPNSHKHSNEYVLNSLGEKNGILTYNDKLVLNDTEYSYRTLPEFKSPNSKGTFNFIESRRIK